MPVEERGLSSRQTQQVARDRRLGNLATPKSVQKLQTALHAKAKAEAGYRFYALYDKISREASWPMPTLSAAPTRAHRGWTVRTSRTSKRTGCSGGLANWRLHSGRRLTDRTPSEECTYRRPMANSGRWASRPCAIGSA